MSGCMIFLGGVSQLAHNTALGVAAMYGGSGAALTDASATNFAANVAPASHVTGLETDAHPAMPFSVADLKLSPGADVSFAPDPATIGSSGAQTPEDEDASLSLQDDTGVPEVPVLSRGGITLSGGYSSVEGPMIEASISRRNIGGLNREVSASARYSNIQMLFELSYADGNFLKSGMAFSPTLFANRLSATGFGNGLPKKPFTQSARGINLHLNRKLGSGILATANYRLSVDEFRMRGKNASCDSSIFGSPICGLIGETTSSIMSFAMTLDRRTTKAGAARGYKIRLTQDLAGLGGSARYSRTQIGGEAYLGMGGESNLSLRVDAGFMTPLGNRAIPLFDRFYIGDTSMRGFDLRGIGPKIIPSAAEPGQSVAIGGRAFYVARAELSLPYGGTIGNYGMQSSVFIDAGSVFGVRNLGLLPGEKLVGNSAKPRVAIGVGLSLNTPAGKLRLDFAQPIVKQTGDRTKTLSISFGAAF